MSYKIKKNKSKKKCYTVSNTKNKRIFSKCTTKKKAMKQLKLLNAIKYGKFKPIRLNKTKKNK